MLTPIFLLFTALFFPTALATCTCDPCYSTDSISAGGSKSYLIPSPCTTNGATATFQFQVTDINSYFGASSFTIFTLDSTNYQLFEQSLPFTYFAEGSSISAVSCFDSGLSVGGTTSVIYVLLTCKNELESCPLQYSLEFDCNGPVISTPTNAPTNPPYNSPTNAPTNPPSNSPTNAPTNPPYNSPTTAPGGGGSSGGLPSGTNNLGKGITGTQIALATFSDSACTTLSSTPEVVSSGTCVYSTAYSTYFSASATSSQSSTVGGQFSCDSTCSSCTSTYSSTQGICQALVGTHDYFTAVTLLPAILTANVFSDSSCKTQTGSISASANTCTQLPVGGGYFAAAMLGNGNAAFAFSCSSDCSTCSQFAEEQLNTCLSVGNGIYTIITSGASALLVSSSLILFALFALASILV